MVHWIKKNNCRFDRSDGAAVIYDHRVTTSTSKPWLEGHRGWAIYLPTQEYPVYYVSKRGFHVPIKYKTSENAIKALEKISPFIIISR